MSKIYSPEELNSFSRETLVAVILSMQVQIASPNGHLCHIRRPLCDLIGGQPGTH